MEQKEHKMYTVLTVINMEKNGVLIDKKLCERELLHGEMIMEDVKIELQPYNPGSPNDLQTLLLGRLDLPVVKLTKKGKKPSFDKEAMQEYERILEFKATSEENDNALVAESILRYRGWQKATSTNYRPYLEKVSPDGRLRTSYMLHRTKTGRWSCENPNLQNIPRHTNQSWNGDMKKAFVTMPGWTLWEFDYSQLEFRLATAYASTYSNSGMEPLIECFEEGRDVFSEMAVKMKMPRPTTKTFVYTTQYGGGINRISHVFGVPASKAQAMRNTYFREYPGFEKLNDTCALTAKTKRKIRLWSGRYRHFAFPKEEAHKAMNSVMQGGAADIVEMQMNRVHHDFSDPSKCRLLLQVHDSLVVEIRDDYAEEVIPKIIETMADIQDFGVKFAVDAHIWGS